MEDIKETYRWEAIYPKQKGGMIAGMPKCAIRLISNTHNFDLAIGFGRYNVDNAEKCLEIYKKFISE